MLPEPLVDAEPLPEPMLEPDPNPEPEPEPEVVTVAARPRTPPDEQRCTRNDGKLWRCKNRKRDNHPLCDLHYAVRRMTPVRPRGTPTRSEKDVWPNGRRGRCHPRKPPAANDDPTAKPKRGRKSTTDDKRKRNRSLAVDELRCEEAQPPIEASSYPPAVIDPLLNDNDLVLAEACRDPPVADLHPNGEEVDPAEKESRSQPVGPIQEKNKETTLEAAIVSEASDPNFLMGCSTRESSTPLPQNTNRASCPCRDAFSITVCMEEMKKYCDIPVLKRLKAIEVFQSDKWRETFTCMDEEVRRAWLEGLQ